MPKKDDYYSILGIQRSSSQDDIKKAYYQMAKKYHPDANRNDPDAQQKFQMVSEAYEVLGDETKRQQYDMFGNSAGDDAQTFRSSHAGGGFRGFTSSIDPEELFRQIFGNRGFRGFDDFEQPGFTSSSEVAMDLSFQQAARGCNRTLEVTSMDACQRCHGERSEPGTKKVRCPACNGSGAETITTGPFVMRSRCRRCGGARVIIKTPCVECHGKGKTRQRKKVVVNVPAGVEDGQTLRMPVGSREIFITFRVEKNNMYRRDGADIHSDIGISLAQAILGGTVRVPGVYDDIVFTIPPGTSSHTRFCLSGKGIRRSHTFGFGDHYIHVKINVPTVLTPQQRALLRSFIERDQTDAEQNEASAGSQTANEAEQKIIDRIRSVLDNNDASTADAVSDDEVIVTKN